MQLVTTMESSEAALEMQVKSFMKRHEGAGLEVEVVSGKPHLKAQLGAAVNEGDLRTAGGYLETVWVKGALAAIKPESARAIAASLDQYLDDQTYTDLIMSGPAREGSVQDRMARLQIVRDSVTGVQQELTGGDHQDKPGAVKAATFVRGSVQTLGLRTTRNALLAMTGA